MTNKIIVQKVEGDDVLRRMLKMPPDPHDNGKPKKAIDKAEEAKPIKALPSSSSKQ